MFDSEFYEKIGALEKGVLIPTCDIRGELAKMSPEEARKAKRKWRKLMRKAKKHHFPNVGGRSDANKNLQRYYARLDLRQVGKKKLEG